MTGPRKGTRRARRSTVTKPKGEALPPLHTQGASFDPAPDTPPIAASSEAPAAVVILPDAEPAPVEGAPRRRRASVGGHSLKLHAPARPGFKRRWFNDDGNRLADAEELGYDFVSDKGLKTSSPGSRVSRLVGTKATGEPLHAFLKETPDELYAQGEAEKEAACRTVDDAIRAGRDSTGQMSSDETYGQGSIKSDR